MSKRDAIVDAARKRFHYYGIAKTTMQEIASDASVAVGTLYLYFRNKDDLIVACADEFIEHHRREAAAILADSTPADVKLRKYVVSRFRMADEMRTGSRHAAELARAVLRVKPDRLQEEGMMMWETIFKILELGNASIFRIGDPAADAKVFLFSIACFFPNALGDPIVPPREEDLLTVVDWFVAMWSAGIKSSRRRKAIK